MTESLVVDPARLKAAGITVRDQKLPTPPPPMAVTGADSVSAAINVTMPIIEAPVISSLPKAEAALSNTGSKIVTAADRYAETDQLLGEHVAKVQFQTDHRPVPGLGQSSASTAALLGAPSTDKKPDDKSGKDTDDKPRPVTPTNFGQLSAMTQAAQPLTQGLQSVMSSAQQAGGMGNTGAPASKLADETKQGDAEKDESSSGEAQLIDETTRAGAGAPSAGSAPVRSAAGGRARGSAPETGL
ncbi:hypothetical protein A5647_11355 [Mycobacterium sp. 1100029.7]|nr:hypothetical protein A5647_11355 [Mycobacterium sp. 1100029.7]